MEVRALKVLSERSSLANSLTKGWNHYHLFFLASFAQKPFKLIQRCQPHTVACILCIDFDEEGNRCIGQNHQVRLLKSTDTQHTQRSQRWEARLMTVTPARLSENYSTGQSLLNFSVSHPILNFVNGNRVTRFRGRYVLIVSGLEAD